MLADALQRLPPPLQVIDAGEPAPSGYGAALGGGYSADYGVADQGLDSAVALAEPEAATGWNPAAASLPAPYEMSSQGAAQVRTSPRAKRRQTSAVGEIVKVVLGGVAGLSITQVVLWWGFHNDPFDLGKTLGANSITRFVVPKVYWPQTDDGTGTPANGVPTKGASNPTAGVGSAHAPPSGGFNSKVDWNSVVTGAPEGGAKGTTPAKPDAEPLVADFDVPGAKPVDPLAFDLGDPLKLDPAAASKPAPPATPAEPATKQDEPAAPAKVPVKPAADARTVAELNAALEVVRQASQSWRDAASGDKDQRRKAAETLYRSLAQLGEVVQRESAVRPDEA